MEEKEITGNEQNAVAVTDSENIVSAETPKAVSKKKSKKPIIIISSIIVVVLVALTVFFCTRGTREIVGVWESDVFTLRSSGKVAQNILVITDSGKGAEITIYLESGKIKEVDTGRFDIKAFSCDFYDDDDKHSYYHGSGDKWTDYYDGCTGFKYNPITNQITSGDRTYNKTDKYQELLDIV